VYPRGEKWFQVVWPFSIFSSPLMQGLDLDPALTTLSIGAGAMTVSHANDSYFWAVSQFSDMEVSVAYRAYTTATLLLGAVSILVVFFLSAFI
jgi:GntP family gluconate:H+ symporter